MFTVVWLLFTTKPAGSTPVQVTVPKSGVGAGEQPAIAADAAAVMAITLDPINKARLPNTLGADDFDCMFELPLLH